MSGIGGQLLEMKTTAQLLTSCKNIDLKFQEIIDGKVQVLILISNKYQESIQSAFGYLEQVCFLLLTR